VLSERERRTLARIERHLVESDPDLARLFARAALRRSEGTASTFLLIAGLAMLVFGSLVAVIPIAVAGMALSMFAVFTAYTRTTRQGRPFFA
jgi:hypothetical protein